jgi:hypothetical protein
LKRLAISLAILTSLATSYAFAGEVTGGAYSSAMKSGQCWGKCAYLSSMQECISCGSSYHGSQNQALVLNYCHKLQPKCGRR